MKKTKFLLIREITAGLWNEMHHVLTQLLAAEILRRVPVVYWSKGSLYASSDGSNAFEQFFQPVSDCNVYDLAKEGLSFCPARWNNTNILLPDPQAAGDDGQETDHWPECDADVCVRDAYIDVEKIIPMIPEGHPFYGLNRRELFYHLLRKYIRLQKEARELIDTFYDDNMKGASFLAVHIRSSDKIAEVPHLNELNGRYAPEIEKVLKANPGMRIFLMTDSIEILEEYKEMYGGLLIHTECGRVHSDGEGIHFQEYRDNKLKGFEIIRDTWLAARCDFFIGNGYSNVSAAVSELKNWKNDRIKLLY
ncbi:MAG: hypothetical protein ACOX4M_00465 [Acetivibrionales bacterium]